MPSEAVKKQFTFVGGLNTEAGPFTFPPNTWASGDNVVPGLDGDVSLRKGLDYEQAVIQLSGATFNAAAETDGAFVVGEWNNVAGDGTRHFLVVQKNTTVEFYINNITLSDGKKSFTINLATYKAAGNIETSGVAPINCSSANGKLLIVSRDTEPLLVEYDATGDSISVTPIVVKIRDLIGVDDGLAVNVRPALLAITFKHLYNLNNQGWRTSTALGYSDTGNRLYPSNAQVWFAGKNSTGVFSQVELDKRDFGTTMAPKGRIVLGAFTRARDAEQGQGSGFIDGFSTAAEIAILIALHSVSGPAVSADPELYRPTACAYYAGRAWYAGVKSLSISNWVFFSQVVDTKDKFGRCYQEADPTSENISDLVATDGGYIPIEEAGTVLKLIPYGNSMLVLCDNGVWQIVGGLEAGFAADAYEVRKLSSVGCISPKSVVQTDSEVLFWGDDDIYIIHGTERGLAVDNITAEKIHTLYQDIPVLGRTNSSGVYVPHERIIYWAYNDDPTQNGTIRRFKKNRLLCLDVDLKSFYTLTIGALASLSPYFTDLFVTKGSRFAAASENVLKFFTIHPISASSFDTTFSEFDVFNASPRSLRDWYTNNNAGVSFTGHLMPGYDFGGEQGGDKFFQALYVMAYLRRTETSIDANGNVVNPSSCLLRARWDWTDGAAGNRQGPQQQVYRHVRPFIPAVSSAFADGHPVVVTKNKVRGRGKALQLRFESEADKDMQLLGWAITYIGNVAP